MSYHNINNRIGRITTQDAVSAESAINPAKINNLTVDTSEMPAAITNRSFRVFGTIGSEFKIHVVQDGTIKYYDFVAEVFTAGHISANNNLIVTMESIVYDNNILFPAGGGTYKIYLTPTAGTEIAGTGGIIVKQITKQASNSVITFQPSTANTSSYATFPTVTSTGAINDINVVSFNWDITNVSTDANGFGLIPTNDYKNLNSFGDKLFFFTTTETVNGAVSLGDEHGGLIVTLDDLTDIGVGSTITAVSAGSLSGTPIITSINTEAKQITLSSTQVFADGITLTFKAVGYDNIFAACGVRFEVELEGFNDALFLNDNLLTKTVRAGSSGTTINLNGTYGVGHNDAATRITGVGITPTTITSVSASSSAGSMVVGTSQGTLTVGTNIYITGVVQVFNVAGNFNINTHPTANKTIHLDVDYFLTPATAS